MCQEESSGHELVTFGNSFAEGHRQAAAVLAYLAASLHGGPDDAFNAQLAIMQSLFHTFPPDSATHRQQLLPFVERFWTNMVEQRSFAFSNPSLVKEALRQARQEPAERRITAILRAIRYGVRSRADEPATAWLNTN
jgi:hypothetical protein